jgi:hypothetical protein
VPDVSLERRTYIRAIPSAGAFGSRDVHSRAGSRMIRNLFNRAGNLTLGNVE